MNIAKVMVKLTKGRREVWTHLCYVDKDLYASYSAERRKGHKKIDMNGALESWAEQTLKETLEVSTTEDLAILKALVKEHYKKKYPNLFVNSATDRQGWMRVWVSDMMEEEIRNGK